MDTPWLAPAQRHWLHLLLIAWIAIFALGLLGMVGEIVLRRPRRARRRNAGDGSAGDLLWAAVPVVFVILVATLGLRTAAAHTELHADRAAAGIAQGDSHG